MSESWLVQDLGLCHVDGESIAHVRFEKVIQCVLEVLEYMDQGAGFIGVLEVCDSCVCCSNPGPVVINVEDATIGAVLKVDSRIVVWNRLKHCCQVDAEESRRKYAHLFQIPCDREGILKHWFDVGHDPFILSCRAR